MTLTTLTTPTTLTTAQLFTDARTQNGYLDVDRKSTRLNSSHQ